MCDEYDFLIVLKRFDVLYFESNLKIWILSSGDRVSEQMINHLLQFITIDK